MALFTYYIRAFQSYADFGGRATRTEYWLFQVLNAVIHYGLLFIAWRNDWSMAVLVVLILYSLVSGIPRLALAIRRLHDTGRSGSWLLLYLLSIFGWIALMFMYAGRSDYDNRYGPAPGFDMST